MKPSQPFWPRGLMAGALLAAFLIIPASLVMVDDAAAGTARLAATASGRFTQLLQPIQMGATGEFFAGRLEVQAVLSQRLIAPGSDQGDPLSGSLARSSMLRLHLENHSPANIEVEIVRVNSALGKFVARPDRLMLAPNQAASIDSLVAAHRIPANSIPVDVALRVAGSLETQHLVLNNRTLAQAGN